MSSAAAIWEGALEIELLWLDDPPQVCREEGHGLLPRSPVADSIDRRREHHLLGMYQARGPTTDAPVPCCLSGHS